MEFLFDAKGCINCLETLKLPITLGKNREFLGDLVIRSFYRIEEINFKNSLYCNILASTSEFRFLLRRS
ncbi:MAG: hypothetical protein F4039_03080 [Gammaproteobacteria bacterium]|nr:hypothetical protein [Gammaproteobacteria bacterium]MYF52761.1 hypothetical protein [Gammaproteobacteria bacterium]MYK43058.1 hypothetical protein [Gammaproteobacteria bacterium]